MHFLTHLGELGFLGVELHERCLLLLFEELEELFDLAFRGPKFFSLSLLFCDSFLVALFALLVVGGEFFKVDVGSEVGVGVFEPLEEGGCG